MLEAALRAQGGGCVIPWDVQSKRIFTEDACAPTLQAGEGSNIMPSVLTQYGEEIAGTLRARYDSSPTPDNGQNAVVQPLVMASGHSHAEIGAGGGRADADRPQLQGRACTSSGADVFPSLCATDGEKQFIDNQSVRSGRLIIEPTDSL